MHLARTIYPSWITRFYIDHTVPNDVVSELKNLGSEIFLCEENKDTEGTFWRFLVNDDLEVDRYIIRDTDSLINSREAAAVEDWIRSTKKFHIMRDHPGGHSGNILTGMWGGTANIFNIKEKISSYMRHTNNLAYGTDMDFARDYIYPLIIDDVIQHDEYFGHIYKDTIKFPKHERVVYGSYVGQRIPILDEYMYKLFTKITNIIKQENYKYRRIINIEKLDEDCVFMKNKFWNNVGRSLYDDFIYHIQQTTNTETQITDDTLIVSNTLKNTQNFKNVITTKD